MSILGLHRGRQRGMVLVTALLLLVVVTILAVGMFRSFGEDEMIAGNMREKHRAVSAAETAEEYAEWWLSTGNGTTGTPCTGPLSVAAGNVQVCATGSVPASFTTLPWTIAGAPVGVTYVPPAMNVTGALGGMGAYYQSPEFYITYLSATANGGSLYQIDAVGYGGSPDTAAVIETVYEVQSNVTCVTPPC
ncbi:MAG TPA: PilX N-terminal domain-containing pilus assembly protein [Steroidobacteraceae bacterium]|nr:PilX N-terminal domain-containing pilus assembly protein [Steroidobacteraceae bacterium]